MASSVEERDAGCLVPSENEISRRCVQRPRHRLERVPVRAAAWMQSRRVRMQRGSSSGMALMLSTQPPRQRRPQPRLVVVPMTRGKLRQKVEIKSKMAPSMGKILR